MTALPIKDRIPPEQVMLFLKEVKDRCRLVTLSEDEYWKTIARVAEMGLTSRQVYDGLLLECVRKSRANTIYTWNLRHFRAIAPELSDRILRP